MRKTMTAQHGKLNTLRYLSFEMGDSCPLSSIHTKCPTSHRERFRFGDLTQTLTPTMAHQFWRWARYDKGFRGIVMFGGYCEPALYLRDIFATMDLIKRDDHDQPFRIYTSRRPSREMEEQFEMVRWTDYSHNPQLDDRLLTIEGEGKSYEEMPPHGWCGHGFGWELPIDYYGNWLMCCNDWRCEEAFGNIHTNDWNKMLDAYEMKARFLQWEDKESYDSLPRLCRACLEKNPGLHFSGGQ